VTPRNNLVLAHLENTSMVNFVTLAEVAVLLVFKVPTERLGVILSVGFAKLVSVASI
jgi:hypothetical protein